jgi:hypothetical protein
MKSAYILVGILSVSILGASAIADDEDDRIDSLRNIMVGPYVSVEVTKPKSEYFLPTLMCKVESIDAPISELIEQCESQRKGWLKI